MNQAAAVGGQTPPMSDAQRIALLTKERDEARALLAARPAQQQQQAQQPVVAAQTPAPAGVLDPQERAQAEEFARILASSVAAFQGAGDHRAPPPPPVAYAPPAPAPAQESSWAEPALVIGGGIIIAGAVAAIASWWGDD